MTNLTADQLLIRIQRAMLARQRYVAQDVFDGEIDHQLLDYVNLLVELSKDAGVSSDDVDAAVKYAAVLARVQK